ncbi:MAG: polymer-forming cytoskeletal protein [Schwartzia sp.]|nr:polymer-forming cytoskeletal protein [Schwartzia sp. (in: firmicutes)]
MFESMRKRVDNPVDDIETIIGKSTAINGQIAGSGNIRVDGRVDGGIAVDGDAIIGESGLVNGDIKAGSLVVAGFVKGNVETDGALCIQPSGQLIGDVKVRSLNILDGGIFKGRSEMAVRSHDDGEPSLA